VLGQYDAHPYVPTPSYKNIGRSHFSVHSYFPPKCPRLRNDTPSMGHSHACSLYAADLLRQTSPSSPSSLLSSSKDLVRLFHNTNPHLPPTMQHPRRPRLLPSCHLPPILRKIPQSASHRRYGPPRNTQHLLRARFNRYGLPL
jgi:hypothetical protein